MSAAINEHDNWVRSDKYHNSFLIKPDEALEHALKTSDENGLPKIAVSAAQGKHLWLVAKSIKAKRVLEVGTLGGYSTIWLARALLRPLYPISRALAHLSSTSQVARANFKHAGVSSKIDIIVGSARETLPKLQTEPFDLVFIDADKESNAIYYKEARRLTKSGSVIIVDNVVRKGRTADPQVNTPDIVGVRDLLQAIKADKGVEATTIATVGEKDYDGFTYILVL